MLKYVLHKNSNILFKKSLNYTKHLYIFFKIQKFNNKNYLHL